VFVDKAKSHQMKEIRNHQTLCAGSFRVTVATDLLKQDVPLEQVQYLPGHADARTTKLYDRRKRQVTRNVVERISV
jgi:site-specific recombinase XerD